MLVALAIVTGARPIMFDLLFTSMHTGGREKRQMKSQEMLQNYSQRVHFYYCILVALKLYVNSKKSGGVRGKNNFLLKWLRNAQNNTIFHPDITSEIEWLRGKIISAGPDADLEPMLQYVYETAKRAETLRLGP